eukprot:g78844.t1
MPSPRSSMSSQNGTPKQKLRKGSNENGASSKQQLRKDLTAMKSSVVGTPMLQAYLKKERKMAATLYRSYSTRYFVLYPGFLVWSVKKGGEIIGVLPLESFHYVAHLEDYSGGKKFDLLVHQTPLQRHTFSLLARSREDAVTWVKHLKIAQKHFGSKKPSFDTTGKFWKNVDLMLTEAVAAAPGWTNHLKEYLEKNTQADVLSAKADISNPETGSELLGRAKSKSMSLYRPSSNFTITTDEIEAPAPPPDAEEAEQHALAVAEAEAKHAAEISSAARSLGQFNRVLMTHSPAVANNVDELTFLSHWREPLSLLDIVEHEVYVSYFYSYLAEQFVAEDLEFVLAVKLLRQVFPKAVPKVRRQILLYLFQKFVSRFAERPATIELEERLQVSARLEQCYCEADVFSRSFRESWVSLQSHLNGFRESQECVDLLDVIWNNQARGLQRKVSAGYKTATFSCHGLVLELYTKDKDTNVSDLWLELEIGSEGKASAVYYRLDVENKPSSSCVRSLKVQDGLVHFPLNTEAAVTIRLLRHAKEAVDGEVMAVLNCPIGDLPSVQSTKWYTMSLPELPSSTSLDSSRGSTIGLSADKEKRPVGHQFLRCVKVNIRTELSTEVLPRKPKAGEEGGNSLPAAANTAPSSQRAPAHDSGGARFMSISNMVRHKVSQKKYRFCEEGFDLDLTYITDNLIAMGYPSENIHGVYRNHLRDVQRFFSTRHKDSFMIFNLCSERDYDAARFGGRKKRFPFEDHNAPPFLLLEEFCRDAEQDLKSGNVVAVHCKAGKGRTGTVIACLVQHIGIQPTAREALDWFGTQRTSNGEGVTIPSQRRYVHYYQQLLKKRKEAGYGVHIDQLLHVKTLHLLKLQILGLSHGHQSEAGPASIWSLKLALRDGKLASIRTRKATELKVTKDRVSDDCIQLTCVGKDGNPVEVRHDVLIEIFRRDKLGKTKVIQCWFNTRFLPDPDASGKCSLRLPKHQLDKVCKDTHHCQFPEGLFLEIFFHAPPATTNYVPDPEKCTICEKPILDDSPSIVRGYYVHEQECKDKMEQVINTVSQLSGTIAPPSPNTNTTHLKPNKSPLSFSRSTSQSSLRTSSLSSLLQSSVREEDDEGESPTIRVRPVQNQFDMAEPTDKKKDEPKATDIKAQEDLVAAERKKAELAAAEKKKAEQEAELKKKADQAAAEKKKADQAAAEQAAAEKKKADQAAAEKKKADEAAAEKEKAEQAAAEKMKAEAQKTSAAPEEKDDETDWTPVSAIKIKEVSNRVQYGDWTRIVHSKTGKMYYWNKKTGKTVWTLPPEMLALGPSEPEPVKAPSSLAERAAAAASSPAVPSWMANMQKGVAKTKAREEALARGEKVDDDSDDDEEKPMTKEEEEEMNRIMKGGKGGKGKGGKGTKPR